MTNAYFKFTVEIINRPLGYFIYLSEDGINPVELDRSVSRTMIINSYLGIQSDLLGSGDWELLDMSNIEGNTYSTFRLKPGRLPFIPEPEYKGW